MPKAPPPLPAPLLQKIGKFSRGGQDKFSAAERDVLRKRGILWKSRVGHILTEEGWRVAAAVQVKAPPLAKTKKRKAAP